MTAGFELSTPRTWSKRFATSLVANCWAIPFLDDSRDYLSSARRFDTSSTTKAENQINELLVIIQSNLSDSNLFNSKTSAFLIFIYSHRKNLYISKKEVSSKCFWTQILPQQVECLLKLPLYFKIYGKLTSTSGFIEFYCIWPLYF